MLAAMGSSPGLRERKKQATRELISRTARRLFLERGFEAVTVAEIARAADVAEKTVFNYFPTKEDLFYHRLEAFEEGLITAIRERASGETVLVAFRGFLLNADRGALAMKSPAGTDEATKRVRQITKLIVESPALVARERQVMEQLEEALTNLVAEETGSGAASPETRAVANALVGVHRALIDYVRRRVLAGDRAAQIRSDVRAEGEQAFARLEIGLGDYAVRGE